jgi:hypothetical protein
MPPAESGAGKSHLPVPPGAAARPLPSGGGRDQLRERVDRRIGTWRTAMASVDHADTVGLLAGKCPATMPGWATTFPSYGPSPAVSLLQTLRAAYAKLEVKLASERMRLDPSSAACYWTGIR